MAYPAGFSDEDEWESDMELSFTNEKSLSTKSYTTVQNILSSEERLVNAITYRKIEESQALLENGVNVNYKPKNDGWPPLMEAAFSCLCDAVELLLKHGADPNIHVKLHTPILCLCSSNVSDEDQLLHCFDSLLKAGAEINVYNAHRETPLMLAAEKGHKGLVLRLIELGADVDCVSCDGWSAIFYAVNGGSTEIVKLLKDAGADITLVDFKSQSLCDVADEKNFWHISQMVSIEDINESYSPSTIVSNYQFVCSEMPNYEESGMNGFHDEMMKTLRRLEMDNLIPLFMEKKIGFGQFLVNKDEDWKEIGVKLGFDRKKLIRFAYNIIRKNWSSEALLDYQKESDSSFKIAQKLSNTVRIVHILVATLHVCNREISNSNFKSNSKHIVPVLNLIKSLKSSISTVDALITKFDDNSCKQTVDYIRPNSFAQISKTRFYNKYYFYTYFIISCIGFSFILRRSWGIKAYLVNLLFR